LLRGDAEGARREYQKAVELDPTSKQVKIELAGISGQKPDDALLAQQVTELKAARSVIHQHRRSQLARPRVPHEGQPKEAEEEYRKILQDRAGLCPCQHGPRCHACAGVQADEAAELLKTVVRAEPTNVQANIMLGDYYERKGNRELALQHLEAAHRVNPTIRGPQAAAGGSLCAAGARR
jgi:cytochrome c-type biogenesis protein CcmH/NrfG